MQKLLMLQIALANLVASGGAEIVGMNWQIFRGKNILFVEPSDDGFLFNWLNLATDESPEHFTELAPLTSVSQLQNLINEVDEDE